MYDLMEYVQNRIDEQYLSWMEGEMIKQELESREEAKGYMEVA